MGRPLCTNRRQQLSQPVQRSGQVRELCEFLWTAQPQGIDLNRKACCRSVKACEDPAPVLINTH